MYATLCAAVGFAALLAACGGSTTPTVSDPLSRRAVPSESFDDVIERAAACQHAPVSARLRADGGLEMDVASFPDACPWLAAIPQQWPEPERTRPVLAIAVLGAEGATTWASRERPSATPVWVLASDVPPRIPEWKGAMHAVRLVDGTLRLPLGSASGVKPGDTYLAIRPHQSTSSQLAGVHEVVEVEEDGASLRSLWAADATADGDLLVYAHPRREAAASPTSLFVAPMVPGGDPPVDALSQAIERWSLIVPISNVSVRPAEGYHAPSEDRAQLDPLEVGTGEFGALIYGSDETDPPRRSLAILGASPVPASFSTPLTGGISLAGIRAEDDVDELFVSAPLSNVLAGRGSTAVALAVAAAGERRASHVPDLAAHLREHIALRLSTLGRHDAGADVIADDIERGRQSSDVRLLENALSIRLSILQRIGDTRGALDDVAEMLRHADEVFAPEEIASLRQTRAMLLARLGDFEQAVAILRAVVSEAQRHGDTALAIASAFSLSDVVAAMDQPALALLIMTSVADDPSALAPSYALEFYLREAELRLMFADPRGAVSAGSRAMQAAREYGDSLTLASTLERASAILYELGQRREAANILRSAGEIYDSIGFPGRAAAAFVASADALAGALQQSPVRGRQLAADVEQTRALLLHSAGLSVTATRDTSAGDAFALAAMLSAQAGDPRSARQLYINALHLALQTADAARAARAYGALAALAAERGDRAAASELRGQAERWSEESPGQSQNAAPSNAED